MQKLHCLMIESTCQVFGFHKNPWLNVEGFTRDGLADAASRTPYQHLHAQHPYALAVNRLRIR